MRLLLLIAIVTLYATDSLACTINNDNYNASPNERAAALKAAADSAYFFSRNFLKEMAGYGSGNLICSPLSCSMVLSMAAYGARGNTEKQMHKGLALPQNNAVAKIGFQALVDSFTNYKQVEFHVANKIFLSKDVQPKCEFTEITTRAFRSKEEILDFNDSNGASRTINQWCAAQTKNRIKNIVTPRDIPRGTGLVLVNAVYFKGTWKTKFDVKNTRPRPFYVGGTTESNIPTMQILNRYNYGVLPEIKCRFVELPYKSKGSDDTISMFIVLPNDRNGLPQLRNDMSKMSVLPEMIRRGRAVNVNLELPKFKIESTLSLEQSLKNMGFADMFTNQADFTGITQSPRLRASKVIQKAFIEVNEEGSEAAAVTAIVVKKRPTSSKPPSPPVQFKADHPFIAMIAITGKNPVNLFTARFIGR